MLAHVVPVSKQERLALKHMLHKLAALLCRNRFLSAQVAALAGTGAPDISSHANIPLKQLPLDDRGRLLRPGVVW